ncbi:MAG: hypothetical protein IJQ82_01830 [Selenomonadaceae bacterium]|nr:hypothetical protein [Selenomonadaceae bacterium]
MGKGICSDDYVGNRAAQEEFRNFYGGSAELPMDIQRRLDGGNVDEKEKAPQPIRGQKG